MQPTIVCGVDTLKNMGRCSFVKATSNSVNMEIP